MMKGSKLLAALCLGMSLNSPASLPIEREDNISDRANLLYSEVERQGGAIPVYHDGKLAYHVLTCFGNPKERELRIEIISDEKLMLALVDKNVDGVVDELYVGKMVKETRRANGMEVEFALASSPINSTHNNLYDLAVREILRNIFSEQSYLK